MWPEFLPSTELVRLARVPALLCRLFLVVPQEGSGDLSRDPEDEVEVEVPSPVAPPVGTTGLLSSAAFASDL